MVADLLEREGPLSVLDDLFVEASAGSGKVALVGGEAGIGKTSLVECFLARRRPATRVLWGACEALFTPRPLGPLYDIAQQARAPLRAAIEGGADRAALFAAVLGELVGADAPTVVVLEDIHWADEATLDLITFLARRIRRTQALLILTHREDGLGKDHPLRLVLGDLPTRDVARLQLSPLSEAAVAMLARDAGRPFDDLSAVTGGNPFFVSEVLASDAPGVPATVRDAVLARAARLSLAGQRLLELVAVVPNRVEWQIVEAASTDYGMALEECLSAGMLRFEETAVGFRHEIARQAVESSLLPLTRRALHATVVHGLLCAYGREQVPLARLLHHAGGAEDRALVLRFAPAAAEQASAQGAHRAAAAHYAMALRYADSLDSEQQAELLDGMSQESYLAGHVEAAVRPCEAALGIWRTLGRLEQVGRDLRRLSRLSWFRFRTEDADRYGAAAVELLETLPRGRELAMAYANLSNLGMVKSDAVLAEIWGSRAVALAEELQDTEIVCYALNSMGAAHLEVGDEAGWALLEHSLHSALEHGYEEHVARAYVNLAFQALARREYGRSAAYAECGIAYCADRDLGSWGLNLRGCRARIRLERGDWAGADEDASALLRPPWAIGDNRLTALLILGQVRARRGDSGAEAALDEALELALSASFLRTGAIDSILSVDAARAECRWLQGDLEGCVGEATRHWQLALGQTYPWHVGELAIWLWRGEDPRDLPKGLPDQFALEIAGDWRAAATQWEQTGCPYEQALALADGDEPAQRIALLVLERLGAGPAAELVRRRLRAAGARGLPRGPRPATLANPHRLTTRQLEILRLLAEGLHNAEIADQLSSTRKTVEHHVSDVLAKLQVRSRAEAIHVAHQLGIVP